MSIGTNRKGLLQCRRRLRSGRRGWNRIDLSRMRISLLRLVYSTKKGRSGFTKREEITDRIACEFLQYHTYYPCGRSNSTHNPPKNTHRRIDRFKKPPEEKKKRELDCPQRR